MTLLKRLCVGDTVEYVGKRRAWKKGELHIITKAMACQDGVQYATNQSAWFTAEDFKLVEKATTSSIKKIRDADEDDEE